MGIVNKQGNLHGWCRAWCFMVAPEAMGYLSSVILGQLSTVWVDEITCCMINSLRPSDAYMRQLTNQHWLI